MINESEVKNLHKQERFFQVPKNNQTFKVLVKKALHAPSNYLLPNPNEYCDPFLKEGMTIVSRESYISMDPTCPDTFLYPSWYVLSFPTMEQAQAFASIPYKILKGYMTSWYLGSCTGVGTSFNGFGSQTPGWQLDCLRQFGEKDYFGSWWKLTEFSISIKIAESIDPPINLEIDPQFITSIIDRLDLRKESITHEIQEKEGSYYLVLCCEKTLAAVNGIMELAATSPTVFYRGITYTITYDEAITPDLFITYENDVAEARLYLAGLGTNLPGDPLRVLKTLSPEMRTLRMPFSKPRLLSVRDGINLSSILQTVKNTPEQIEILDISINCLYEFGQEGMKAILAAIPKTVKTIKLAYNIFQENIGDEFDREFISELLLDDRIDELTKEQLQFYLDLDNQTEYGCGQ